MDNKTHSLLITKLWVFWNFLKVKFLENWNKPDTECKQCTIIHWLSQKIMEKQLMQGMNGARLHSLTVFFDFRSANQVLSYGINYIFKSMSLSVRRHILLGNWWEISKNSFFFITSQFFSRESESLLLQEPNQPALICWCHCCLCSPTGHCGIHAGMQCILYAGRRYLEMA